MRALLPSYVRLHAERLSLGMSSLKKENSSVVHWSAVFIGRGLIISFIKRKRVRRVCTAFNGLWGLSGCYDYTLMVST